MSTTMIMELITFVPGSVLYAIVNRQGQKILQYLQTELIAEWTETYLSSSGEWRTFGLQSWKSEGGLFFNFLFLLFGRNKLKDSYILYGHRQVRDTSCPGDALFKEIQSWPHWVWFKVTIHFCYGENSCYGENYLPLCWLKWHLSMYD